MDKPGFTLKDANIAIIGLGLMGGSLALSLKERCRRLSAFDPHLPTLELARRQEIVHLADSDPAKILADADLVILACPVPAIVDWLESPARIHPASVHRARHRLIQTDDCCRARNPARKLRPDWRTSHLWARAALTGKCRAFSVPRCALRADSLSRTSEQARSAALQIVEALGANPVWLDADDHDRILAATSHLPYLLSSALALATPKDAAPLIGPGFRSSARLAGTPSSMMLGVLQSNADNVLSMLSTSFRQSLTSSNPRFLMKIEMRSKLHWIMLATNIKTSPLSL